MKKYLLLSVLLVLVANSYSQCVTTYGDIYETRCYYEGGYLFDGNLLEGSGVYTETLTNYHGCDSIVTLYLTVYEPASSVSYLTLCSSQLPYTWNGIEVQEGYNEVDYPYTCGDSAAILYVTINPSPSSETDVTICPEQFPYTWNGKKFAGPGYYSVTIITPNPNDCDSIANLNLSETPNPSSTTNLIICGDKAPYAWNGQSLTATGTYKAILPLPGECDSIAILNLTVKPLATVTSFSPAIGSTGQAVVITGTNFNNVSGVSFGGTPASSFSVQSSTSIIATVGANAGGTVSVTTDCNTATLGGFSYNTSPGNMGVGTPNPTSKFTIGGGDLQITDIGSGIILKSPNGNCWRITIDNSGNLIRTQIPCP